MAIEIPDKFWSYAPIFGPLRTMILKASNGEPITLEDHLANMTGGATTVISDVASTTTGVPKPVLWILAAVIAVAVLLVVI